jgi:hypothetical protein
MFAGEFKGHFIVDRIDRTSVRVGLPTGELNEHFVRFWVSNFGCTQLVVIVRFDLPNFG